jgi:methionine biosynthesis protein MetW
MADALAAAPFQPDAAAGGFLSTIPDPLRYDNNHDMSPHDVAGLIVTRIPRGSRVLDIGCGTGALSILMRDHRQAKVIGVEPDAQRAARAQARGIETHVGVLSPELTRVIQPVDAVVFADVLEHLADPLSELRTARLAMKSDGLLLLSVPNVAHWSVRWALLRGRFDYAQYGIMDATHLRWFTRRSIRALVEAAGFSVIEMHGSALLTLACYMQGMIGRVPVRMKAPLVQWSVRQWPGAFAAQHVVIARRSR